MEDFRDGPASKKRRQENYLFDLESQLPTYDVSPDHHLLRFIVRLHSYCTHRCFLFWIAVFTIVVPINALVSTGLEVFLSLILRPWLRIIDRIVGDFRMQSSIFLFVLAAIIYMLLTAAYYTSAID
ncbi:hypothetical protein PROFUN_04887 [Planoprotostelium fungivorum]|uniref:Uncharacterized protein n=1 Tax=Planoprotostelium fungivorum TaxID=1890364 RepID=A0A2P6NF64_9EUKA|nr:hypothetical protein PROFUN_04887 [Planoprotostelium fungivorum]